VNEGRRLAIAIVLMVVAFILPQLIWPPKKPVQPPAPAADTTAAAPSPAPRPAPAASAPRSSALQARSGPAPVAAETVWVSTPLLKLGFSTAGGELVSAQLLDYRSFARGDSASRAEILGADEPALRARLAAGKDTVDLSQVAFAPSVRELKVGSDSATLSFGGKVGGGFVTLSYTFYQDSYRFSVRGQATGLGSEGAVLLLGLGEGLRSVEADSVDDFRHAGVVTRATKSQILALQSVDSNAVKILDGPFEWAGVKSKYFFLAALAIEDSEPPFAGAIVEGRPRTVTTHSLFGTSHVASRAGVTLTLPVPAVGAFRYQVYAGPLDSRRLSRIGHDLDDANPYGGLVRFIVKPVSQWVVAILLWMHGRLSLAYGWVLVIFGVLVRVLLWPLSQKAMESSVRMQALQPLLEDLKARHKNDPERMQKETLRLYKEHKVNPLGGCLPMLLPWPVLIALFFVFSNTIEFRGVSFLWLPDLSRADPYFIIPIVMGLSMFALSKVGQMGVPPNPQTKTMLYVMPAMMTFLFMRFSSGVNLYYAVSNICSIPQQFLIARRRLQQQGARKTP